MKSREDVVKASGLIKEIDMLVNFKLGDILITIEMLGISSLPFDLGMAESRSELTRKHIGEIEEALLGEVYTKIIKKKEELAKLGIDYNGEC